MPIPHDSSSRNPPPPGLTISPRAGKYEDLLEELNGVDIYLIDQILKGRFSPGRRILEAGCGAGRNLIWFMRTGFDVCGIDSSAGAVARVRELAALAAPHLPRENFRVEPVEETTFAEASFDAVLSIAVLHFARNEEHFGRMVGEMWRVLRPGGVLFARLGSTIGIESLVTPLGNRRYEVPDGSTRFLVDLDLLLQTTAALGADLLEPVKTVNVQNLRCMTTWVLRKRLVAPGHRDPAP